MDLLVNNAPKTVFDIEGTIISLDGIYHLSVDAETGASIWVQVYEESLTKIIGHNGTAWVLFFGDNVVQSSPCNVSVQPWEAIWPSPMFVGKAGDPRFYRHTVGNENGEVRFKRLRNAGYV